MTLNRLAFLTSIVAAIVFSPLMGCGSADEPVPVPHAGSPLAVAIERVAGDYSKLTPEEKKLADDASHGHGLLYAKKIYREAHL